MSVVATDGKQLVSVSLSSVLVGAVEYSAARFECARDYSVVEVAELLAQLEHIPEIAIFGFHTARTDIEQFGPVITYLVSIGVGFIGVAMPRHIRPLYDSFGFSKPPGHGDGPWDMRQLLVYETTFQSVPFGRASR